MRAMFRISAVAWIGSLLFGAVASAQEYRKVEATDYVHDGAAYPPVLFVSNIEDSGYQEKLEGYNAFEKLDRESVGLPIGVRVLEGYRKKNDGTQFSTLMLSASTLGLIPVVSNTEFKVRYDVFVQGDVIETFHYKTDSTDMELFWTMNQSDRQTKPAEKLFLEYTIPQFLHDIKMSDEVQKAFREYTEYFGGEAAAGSRVAEQ